MIRASVRPYSNKASPGFLSDLLARIDSIPERVAQRKQENLENATKRLNKDSAKSNNNSSPNGTTSTPNYSRSKNIRINVADHPLALFNDSNRSNFNRTRRANSNNFSNGQRPQGNGPKPSSNKPFQRKSTTPRRIVSSDKRVRDQRKDHTKKIEYGPSQPALSPADLFYSRSSKLSHSTSARIASVSKGLLEESKYPYSFPQEVVQNAPKQAVNLFLLNNKYDDQVVSNENLKNKVESIVLGRVRELNSREKQIPKGLKAHALFARRAILLNPTLSLDEQQRLYDVVSGVKTPSSLVEGCHWVKK